MRALKERIKRAEEERIKRAEAANDEARRTYELSIGTPAEMRALARWSDSLLEWYEALIASNAELWRGKKL